MADENPKNSRTPGPTPRKERIGRLLTERNDLRKRLELRKVRGTQFRYLGAALLVASPIAWMVTKQTALLVGCIYGLPLLFSQSATSTLELQILDLDDQLDAIDFESADMDLRAERQLKLHQRELKRYYDQQLAQSQWVFLLGAFCVAAGVAIAGATIFLLAQPATAGSPTQDKLLIAAVGGVSSLLTNFVAAIYLKIHSGTVSALVEFHHRMVATHRIHFAYFLATKVDEDVVKPTAPLLDETLAALSLKVVESEHPVQKPPKDATAATKKKKRPKSPDAPEAPVAS